MNEENKANEQDASEAKEEVQEETQETTEETTENAQEPEDTKSSEDIDYKAELEKERARRQKAESIIQRNKEKTDEVPDGMSTEDLDELVAAKVRTETEGLERRLTQSTLTTLISEVSNSPEETELIKYHVENTVRPSGDLRADVGKAKLLANAGKFQSQLSEYKRTVSSKANASAGGGAGHKKQVSDEPQLNEAEKRFRRNLGLNETPKK